MNQEQWRPLPGNAKTADVLHRHMILTVWHFFRRHLAYVDPVARLNISQNHINRIGMLPAACTKASVKARTRLRFVQAFGPRTYGRGLTT